MDEIVEHELCRVVICVCVYVCGVTRGSAVLAVLAVLDVLDVGVVCLEIEVSDHISRTWLNSVVDHHLRQLERVLPDRLVDCQFVGLGT